MRDTQNSRHANNDGVNTNKPRILLIEDDVDLKTLIGEYYGPRGYDVSSTDDPNAIVRGIEHDPQFKKNFDVILTDLVLPGANGIDFIRRMKSLSPGTPIILITAHGSVEIAVEAIAAGAFDFVLKPLHFPQLTISLERAMQFKRLQEENQALRKVARPDGISDEIVGRSSAIRRVIDVAERVSKSSASILITGESGTGKEVVARLIHRRSDRRSEPFIALNCSAIPEHLLESELFGHVKGAFTGAQEKRIGLFEEANKGTLFLDEIGDLNLSLQAKLLRVLQERKIKRVGENIFRDIDVRIVAATHKNLPHEVREGQFREDLYFRLNVIPIHIPALRERPEDILPLAEHFLRRFAENQGRSLSFSKAALDFLLKRQWKGNVRELENTIERAAVLSTGNEIQADNLAPIEQWSSRPEPVGSHDTVRSSATGTTSAFFAPSESDAPLKTLDEIASEYIEYVMKRVGGVKEQAARILNIDRKTLYRRIQAIEAKKRELNPTMKAPTSRLTTELSPSKQFDATGTDA